MKICLVKVHCIGLNQGPVRRHNLKISCLHSRLRFLARSFLSMNDARRPSSAPSSSRALPARARPPSPRVPVSTKHVPPRLHLPPPHPCALTARTRRCCRGSRSPRPHRSHRTAVRRASRLLARATLIPRTPPPQSAPRTTRACGRRRASTARRGIRALPSSARSRADRFRQLASPALPHLHRRLFRAQAPCLRRLLPRPQAPSPPALFVQNRQAF